MWTRFKNDSSLPSLMEPCSIVIFGATGDLAHKKLIPALRKLHDRGKLHERTRIHCLGRRQYTTEQLCKEYGVTGTFCERISYHLLEFEDLHEYETLRLDHPNRLFYLATPQDAFGTIVKHMQESKLAARNPAEGWHRVIFEKPFGSDLASARELNRQITTLFSENQIYRIDHYVGKSFVREILALRFSNPVFQAIWNSRHVDRVRITVSEDKGVGSRAGYYDRAGALRDMVQNHLLQLLTLTAMEMPPSLENIRDEKAKVLGAVDLPAEKDIVCGQYEGYRDEKGADSDTETFAAVKLGIDNPRWKGIPFHLVTGKCLQDRYAEIELRFSTDECPLFNDGQKGCGENLLVIKIQPDEGIRFVFNLAEDTGKTSIAPHAMEYSHAAIAHNTPEAYELLLAECMKGDQTLFTRWDFVEQSWKLIDHIRKKRGELHTYKPGSQGPLAALRMR